MDKLSRDEELRALAGMWISDSQAGHRLDGEDCAEMLLQQLARHDAQGEAEPEAWQFQHNETGQMTELSRDGINTPETFMRDNPRYEYVGPLYRHPAPTSKREAVVTDAIVCKLLSICPEPPSFAEMRAALTAALVAKEAG